HFGAAIEGELRISRLDGVAAVEVAARVERVPGDPRMREAMMGALADDAAALTAFGAMWQERVRRLLLEYADDPDVISVRGVTASH
ncbi:MAG: hypothetical protein IT501_01210, partial [Rubrivivax sp.]|nr:hypothetical protein [Rubrivivax sp.]